LRSVVDLKVEGAAGGTLDSAAASWDHLLPAFYTSSLSAGCALEAYRLTATNLEMIAKIA
jgi:hypothetical protein